MSEALVYENKLNVFLSELLARQGVISRSELLNRGRRDVVVYHQGLRIVLEGSYSKADAEKDAKRRIEQLAADVALAVHYPHIFPQHLTDYEVKEKLAGTKLPVRIIVPEDVSGTLWSLLMAKQVVAKPIEDWYELDLASLSTLIREIGAFIISEEGIKEVEDKVSALIQSFVEHLSSHTQSETIARNLYDVLYKLYGFSIGDPVGIKEAIFAQAALAILLSSVYYESVRYVHKLDSLQSLAKLLGPSAALEKATDDILAIDYRPIFESTHRMLKLLPPITNFDNLIDLATYIASKKTLLRRDLAGKIYHKVVGDWGLKKGLGTYYTEIPAAYLLSYLAKPSLCKIADFACGSGTLLVAAYSAANTEYRLSLLRQGVDRDPKELEKEFHTTFIRSCYGFDVLEYATQITALNLAFHSPETPLEDFSVYALPLGYREEDQTVSLGSLEFVRTTGQLGATATKTSPTKKETTLIDRLQGMEPFDLVVMNPPFTRTTGRGGRPQAGLFGFMGNPKARGLVKSQYERLRNEVKTKLETLATKTLYQPGLDFLLTEPEFQPFRNVWQAGEGFMFLYLAHLKLKNGGKLCFVLPRSVLSGSSWFLARVMLAAFYHIQYVVVSYEGGSYNFSYSTSLSECLLVAKRVELHQDNEETVFVILLRKPKTSIEAIALADAIGETSEGYVEAGNSKAFLVRVKREELLQYLDNWGRFVFLPHMEILQQVKNLLAGVLKIGDTEARIPLVKLNSIISSIGVDRHRFTDTFKVIGQHVPGSFKILHGGGEEIREKMEVSPNAYALPIIPRGNTIFANIAGSLLVPNRIWLDTAHVISLLSREPIISNIFYVVKLKQENQEKLKALCFWLNTTWGILSVLANREETRGGWIELNQSHWRLLPVLDVTALPRDKLGKLASLFDMFKSVDLPRLPQQYGFNGSPDKKRLELDLAFLEAMDIKAKEKDLVALYEQVGSPLKQWLG